MTGLRMAFAFLTVLPTGLRAAPKSMAQARAYFPLVGLALGGVLLGLDAGLRHVFPALLTGAIMVVALLALTRGLHMDGLMDTCDGLLGGYTRERRLEILRDPHLGAFAVMGGVAVLLLKWTALVGLPPSIRASALVLFPGLGRWAMVFVMSRYPYARAEGIGSVFMEGRRHWDLPLAFAVSLGASLLLAGAAGAIFLALTTVVAWALGHWMSALLGGLTGDTYGAINEVTEVAVLLVAIVVATVAPAMVGWPLPWGGTGT